MAGFGADLDRLRSAAGYVADAAELAGSAGTGVSDNQVDAPRPLPIPEFPFGFGGGGGGSAAHVFGDSLGFDAIAFAYSRHVDAVRGHLSELRESAEAGSKALDAVAGLYERADESGKL
ncbi:hypothetical protein B1813_13080 [Saccharomonospora piscinae]|uniref:Excreted virulence factor EspC, type VII ESX diderm n=1 Tax=Saccharomonospora piscinae TaxID=687388 RepID=A0A1V9A7K6_SACPI|nr:hypothetical protein [Saccharomonospora piscinae]OQO93028.1 hypothetical protein B1813_13080 [Saccharomonospora piscinae]